MPLRDDIITVYRRHGFLPLIGYGFEAAGLLLLFGLLRLLPLDAASAFGGWLGRNLGPHLGVHQRAQKHLTRALPGLSQAEHTRIIARMWDNMGRTMAEYPHLKKLHNLKRIEAVGISHIHALRDDGKAGIVVGAHLGNWEVGPILIEQHGLPLAVVFRNPNNPFVGAMLDRTRQSVAAWRMPKGPQGGMALARHLKKHGHIGMLIDQKLNEGLPLTFFGLPAMTAPAAAQWALRMNLPVVAIRTQRLKGAHFRVSFEPVESEPGDTPENVARLAQRMNDIFERYIRDDPGQWLWLHRRWKEEKPA